MKIFRISITALTILILFFSSAYMISAGGGVWLRGIRIDEDGADILLTGNVPPNTRAEISGETAYTHLSDDYDVPVRILFLIDIRNTITNTPRQQTREILSNLILQKDPSWQFAIYTFCTDFRRVTDFSDHQLNLYRAVNELSWGNNNQTRLNNAVFTALTMVEALPVGDINFSQIVAFTDARSTAEYGITGDELLRRLADTAIPVHTVGFLRADNATEINEFHAFSRATGGLSFDIRHTDSTNEVISGISDYIQNHALIRVSFPADLRDGAIRPLELFDESRLLLSLPLNMPRVLEPQAVPATEQTPAATPHEIPGQVIFTPVEEESGIPVMIIIVIAVFAVLMVVAIVIVCKLFPTKSAVEKSPEPAATEFTVIDNGNVYDDDQTMMLIPGERKSSSEKTVYLILHDKNEPHKRFEIAINNKIEIGREPNMPGITINYDKKISRRHCQVTLEHGILWLEDLGSANKTHINDVMVESKQMLVNNDELMCGIAKFIVNIESK